MNINLTRGTKVVIEIEWAFLHVIYAVLSLIKQFVPSSNTNFYTIFRVVESDLKERVRLTAEANRIHLCERCLKEIDTTKDEYERRVFESGYEQYIHTSCPATNTKGGYFQ